MPALTFLCALLAVSSANGWAASSVGLKSSNTLAMPSVSSAPDPRKALVEDTEANRLNASGLRMAGAETFELAGAPVQALGAQSGRIRYLVPVRSIRSIRREGRSQWSIRYLGFAGELSLDEVKCQVLQVAGESGLGRFTIDGQKLKQLAFEIEGKSLAETFPAAKVRDGKLIADAVVTLTDGQRLPAANLSLISPVSGKLGPGARLRSRVQTLTVRRGGFVHHLPFEQVARLDLVSGARVEAVLRNNATLKGVLMDYDFSSSLSLLGLCDRGGFAIALRDLKSIEFLTATVH